MKTKFRIFSSLEKEEAWLNKQLQQGLQLIHAGGEGIIYRFEPISNSEMVIRMDFQYFKTKDAYLDYLQFMEDAGWHYLGGAKRGEGNHYFIGNQYLSSELFSDVQSKLEREKRTRRGLINSMILIGIMLLIIFHDTTDWSLIWHPERYYLPVQWKEDLPGVLGTIIMSFLGIAQLLFNYFPLIAITILLFELLKSQMRIEKYKNQLLD